MTTNIDIQFRYAQHPTEDTMRAVAELYDVYGIRRVRLNQADRTVLVEYDATRLSSAVVFQLLRRAGLSVTEQISAFAPHRLRPLRRMGTPLPPPDRPSMSRAVRPRRYTLHWR